MDKKRLFLWGLYDFANSIVIIAFFLYYSQWLVVEKGMPDFYFNLTYVVSSLLLLLTAPVAGIVADKRRLKLPGLRLTTLLAVLFFLLTAGIAVFYPRFYVLSAVCFTLALYFYLFAFVFYNSMLEDVASPEKQGRASGWGQFGNWLGQIVGILCVMPFVNSKAPFFGEPGRAQALIPATLFFFLLATPIMLFFKEKAAGVKVKIDYLTEYNNIWNSFLKLWAIPGLGLFFLSYFFCNDAIITFSNNYAILLQKVYGSSDTIKSILLVSILIASAISAPISGYFVDRFGAKRVLLVILSSWVVLFPLLTFAPNFQVFATVSVIAGLGFGAMGTVTRALVARLAPSSKLNQSFTYYTLLERFATFVGPISWGLIVAFAPKTNGLNYKAAILGMTIFVLLGLWIARKIPDTKKITTA